MLRPLDPATKLNYDYAERGIWVSDAECGENMGVGVQLFFMSIKG